MSRTNRGDYRPRGRLVNNVDTKDADEDEDDLGNDTFRLRYHLPD